MDKCDFANKNHLCVETCQCKSIRNGQTTMACILLARGHSGILVIKHFGGSDFTSEPVSLNLIFESQRAINCNCSEVISICSNLITELPALEQR